MNRYKSLEHLANGIYAASKINEIMALNRKDGNRSKTGSDNASSLSRMLSAVSEHAPQTHRSVLNQTIEQCDLYLNTYRNLKQHYRSTIRTGPGREDLLTTMGIVKPLLSGRSRTLIENIIGLLKSINDYGSKRV